MDRVLTYFLLFMIYSVLGFLSELIFCTIVDRKLTLNRGFLIGPYCPIYGTGALCMMLFLTKYENDPVVLFVMSALIATILEYITSYIMEKIFCARWWDYSNKKFHINGRVALDNAVFFGIAGLFVIYFLNPKLMHILSLLNNSIKIVISIILLIIFLVDLSCSTTIIFKLRTSIKEVRKDMTEEISKKVHQTLQKSGYFTKRLINAFPNAIIKKGAFLKDFLEKQKNKIRKKRNVIQNED